MCSVIAHAQMVGVACTRHSTYIVSLQLCSRKAARGMGRHLLVWLLSLPMCVVDVSDVDGNLVSLQSRNALLVALSKFYDQRSVGYYKSTALCKLRMQRTRMLGRVRGVLLDLGGTLHVESTPTPSAVAALNMYVAILAI